MSVNGVDEGGESRNTCSSDKVGSLLRYRVYLAVPLYPYVMSLDPLWIELLQWVWALNIFFDLMHFVSRVKFLAILCHGQPKLKLEERDLAICLFSQIQPPLPWPSTFVFITQQVNFKKGKKCHKVLSNKEYCGSLKKVPKILQVLTNKMAAYP